MIRLLLVAAAETRVARLALRLRTNLRHGRHQGQEYNEGWGCPRVTIQSHRSLELRRI
jgi:hypothetical protein